MVVDATGSWKLWVDKRLTTSIYELLIQGGSCSFLLCRCHMTNVHREPALSIKDIYTATPELKSKSMNTYASEAQQQHPYCAAVLSATHFCNLVLLLFAVVLGGVDGSFHNGNHSLHALEHYLSSGHHDQHHEYNQRPVQVR